MRDEDQRAAEVLERVEQHVLRVEIEMVGRLVEQQRVRRAGAACARPPAVSARRRTARGPACRRRRLRRGSRPGCCGCSAPCGWGRRRRASGRPSASDRAASPRPARSTASPPDGLRCGYPASGASTPDSIRIIVDLPAPFGPTSAIRSPRSMCRLTPAEHVQRRRSSSTRSCRSSTVRPLFAQAGNEKWTRFRSGGISIGTILSSILIRLCTCAALVAW